MGSTALSARFVAGADPTSLGVLAPPGAYGAELAVGDLQPLGHHPSLGGTSAGFLATRLDERLIAELPAIYIVAVPTEREGEHDFFWGNFEATSYETRGHATDFTGCSSALAGIVSGSGPTVAFLVDDADSAIELQVALSAARLTAVRVHGPVHGARVLTH